jgi:hypothetical protein
MFASTFPGHHHVDDFRMGKKGDPEHDFDNVQVSCRSGVATLSNAPAATAS